MPRARKGSHTEKDAITLLKDDHKQVRALLGELEETTDKAAGKREKLLGTIEQELTIHTRIEEEIFYPAFREAARKKDDTKLYFEALEEHHVVDMVLPEIKETGAESDQFAAKAKVLKDLVEHHTSFAGRAFQQIYHVELFDADADAEGALLCAGDSWCFRTWWEGGYLACGTPRESIFIFGGPFTRGSMGDTADLSPIGVLQS